MLEYEPDQSAEVVYGVLNRLVQAFIDNDILNDYVLSIRRSMVTVKPMFGMYADGLYSRLPWYDKVKIALGHQTPESWKRDLTMRLHQRGMEIRSYDTSNKNLKSMLQQIERMEEENR